ncbi:MAG: AAA family ATPase [Bacteroidia bacterium]|nr:AAA family ATPase [Bacteroidia bacterium]
MWIKSCDLKAFGSIKGKTFTFDKGVNCLVENNGAGKTTLADFIRVMLYGMKTTSVKDSTMGDRRRYLPFDAVGMFGGSMTIMVGEKEVVITRHFDIKSNSKDTLTINGIEDNEEEQTIGERYFNIDEDAFRRTVYVTSQIDDNEEVRATDSINRNMDMMVTDINTVNLSKVLDTLDERCSELQTSNRTKKNRGELNKLDDEEESINNTLSELNEIDKNLSGKYERLNRHYDEQREIKEKLAVARKKLHEHSLWKQIDELSERVNKNKEALAQLNSRYPKGLVSETDITALSEANIAIERSTSALSAMQESEESKAAYEVLERRYSVGYDANEYENIKILQKGIEEKRIRIEAESNTPIKGEEHIALFSNGIPSEEQLEEIKTKALRYSDNVHALSSLATMGNQHKTSILPSVLSVIIGLAIGITLISMGYNFMGGVFAFGMHILAAMLYVLNKQKGTQQSQSRAIEINEENSRLERELKRFFAPWGYYDTAFVEYAEALSEKIKEYNSYLEAKANRDNELKVRMLNLNKDQEKITEYIERYGVKELTDIESGFKLYEKQKEDRAHREARHAEQERIMRDNKALITSILDRYELEIPDNLAKRIDDYKTDLSTYHTITSRIKDIEGNIEEIKRENQLSSRPTDIDGSEDENSLQARYDMVIKEIGKITEEIEDDDDRVKKIDDYETRLEAIKERRAILLSKLSLLKKTKAFIESADRALKDRFVGPIKDKYGLYMSELLPRWAEDIEMGTDYRVRVKYDNVLHDCDHLSQGERRCLEMALRIAIIDNMYKEEKPFLIMDDPFVELDSDNMQKANDLVHKIAEHYQVVYFCCHPSRTIN